MGPIVYLPGTPQYLTGISFSLHNALFVKSIEMAPRRKPTKLKPKKRAPKRRNVKSAKAVDAHERKKDFLDTTEMD
ncbi:MAG: hypothetical protein ACR2PF_11410, partial [Rhizobiaceae bacterium]